MVLEIGGDVTFIHEGKDLAVVAQIVSEKLTGKKDSFHGRENYIYDEVPAVYTDDFLGLRIVVLQNPEETEQFTVQVVDRRHVLVKNTPVEVEQVDLSERIYALIKDCTEFQFLDEEDY